ncbi:hypothetical protein [Kitasatospora cinereorecta]|uniref:Uncharacterized protein n=1 Tax=Kitasatospora cinereorecta TaxID=285560 RepID=A0ABW0VDM7_9ACTN
MAIEIDLPLAPDAGKGVDIDELADTGNEAFLRAVLRRPVRFHHRSTERLDGGVAACEERVGPDLGAALKAL